VNQYKSRKSEVVCQVGNSENGELNQPLPSPSDRLRAHILNRPSLYLLEPTDLLRFVEWGGMMLLADCQGVPVSYEFALLVRDVINEVYEDLTAEEISDIATAVFERQRPKSFSTAAVRQPKPGVIYLLSAAGKYKIGRTTGELPRRISQIQQSVPWPLTLEHSFPSDDTVAEEKKLHDKFASKRVAGEWFALSENDVKYIKTLGGGE
jgi:hypothetical protein